MTLASGADESVQGSGEPWEGFLAVGWDWPGLIFPETWVGLAGLDVSCQLTMEGCHRCCDSLEFKGYSCSTYTTLGLILS